MKSHGSSFGVGLLALALGMGVSCKKEETPKPEPAPEVTSPRPAVKHNPRMPGARMDPQANKDHRIDYCYYGTFSLRQARDAYYASLGKDEPSAKKIPNLGAPVTTGETPKPPARPAVPASTAGPSSSAAAKPLPVAKPAAAGGAPSAGPTVAPGTMGETPKPPGDHRLDPSLRLPHERNARSCTAALALKEPPMADVDAQMALFAPFAVELAKDISAAQTYYQQQEYTKDSFARGKELDKKLREEFAKLDDLSDKLGAAMTAWRQEHPPDLSKMEEGEKISRVLIDAARDVFMLVATHKADGEAWKGAMEKLDKSVEALKAFADGHQADVWGKIMSTSAEPFVKTVKSAVITPGKTFEPDAYLTLVTNFTAILEGRLRSASRAGMSRATLPLSSGAPGSPPPPAQPAQPPQ